MPKIYCIICGKQVPDGHHKHLDYCKCKSDEQWLSEAKRNNWMINLGDKEYNFTKIVDTEYFLCKEQYPVSQVKALMEGAYEDGLAKKKITVNLSGGNKCTKKL